MQTDDVLDVLFRLAFVVLCLGVLICVYNMTRPSGISKAFNNAEGATQDMSEAELRVEQINSVFNNDRNAKQILRGVRIGRGESRRAANSETVNEEVQKIKNVLAKLIAYLFGEKQQPNHKDKSK